MLPSSHERFGQPKPSGGPGTTRAHRRVGGHFVTTKFRRARRAPTSMRSVKIATAGAVLATGGTASAHDTYLNLEDNIAISHQGAQA
jgi:hypothetical protein